MAGGHCREMAVIERCLGANECMDCLLGHKKVATVRMWPLVEVGLNSLIWEHLFDSKQQRSVHRFWQRFYSR